MTGCDPIINDQLEETCVWNSQLKHNVDRPFDEQFFSNQ
jgi:hypothetical protein